MGNRAGSSPVSPTMLSGLCDFNRMNPVIKALGAGERTGALCKGKSSNCTLKHKNLEGVGSLGVVHSSGSLSNQSLLATRQFLD